MMPTGRTNTYIPVPQAEQYLHGAYEQLKHHKPLSPKCLFKLKQAEKGYKANVDELYNKRGFIKKVLYFFGIGLSTEEKAQLSCIRKISKLRDVAKYGSDSKYVLSSIKSAGQSQLLDNTQKAIKSEQFLKLLSFSLKDSVTAEEVKEIKQFEGTKPYVPDAFFADLLSEFSQRVSGPEKEQAVKLQKAFRFNAKVNWKSVKHQSLSTSDPSLSLYQNRPWYTANAGAALHKAIDKMKPGDEVVFSGTHMATGLSQGHAVLFSCNMHDNDTLRIRMYNTGLGASVVPHSSISVSVPSFSFWSWLGIGSASTSDDTQPKNIKTKVNQAFFKKEDVLSDRFSEIFTSEILLFKEMNALSNEVIFPKYNQFVSHCEVKVPDAPTVPELKAQKVGNCAIASKLAYIEDKLGPQLYEKFKGFMQHKIGDMSRER